MVIYMDVVILVYDLDNFGKFMYDYDLIWNFSDIYLYLLILIDFDWLQESVNEYVEKQNNGFNFE